MPEFRVLNFSKEDLLNLDEFQPTDWKPIKPHFEFYLNTPYCLPLKMDRNGYMVAIGNILFHKDTAWLSHIIVHPEMRNLGLGKQMTNALLEQVNTKVYQSVFLMATDLGYPVYQSIGFETEDIHLFLMKEDPLLIPDCELEIQDASKEHFNAILEMDRLAYDEDRMARIYPHLQNAKVLTDNRRLRGFFLPDLNEGPVIASDPEAGLALMKYRLRTQEVAILPESNELACQHLSDLGFNAVRKARRMFLGKRRNFRSDWIFNRVSGQIG